MKEASENVERGEDAQLLAVPTWTMEVSAEPSVFELVDGRAIVTFASGNEVIAVDTAGITVDSFGRFGAGPGEFQLTGVIAPLEGRRIGIIDPVLRRLTVLSENLDFLTTVDLPGFHDAFSARVLMDGAWVSLSPGAGDRRDSSYLRYSPARASSSSVIAAVHTPPSQFLAFGDVGFNLVPEYQPRDVWGVNREGEIWIARGGPNRLDRVRVDGNVTIGQAVPYPEIRTVPADLTRWRGQPAPEILRTAENRPMSRIKAPFQGAESSPSGDVWFWVNQPHGYETEIYLCRDMAGRTGVNVRVAYGSKLIHVGHREL